MAKEDRILAIDVGGDSLKLAEFVYPDDGGVILEKFAFAEYEMDLENTETDSEDDFAEKFEDSLRTLLDEHDFIAKKVRMSISGQSAFIRLAKLPPLGDDEGRVHQIVEYEAKQTVPFPMDEVVWDYQLIHRLADTPDSSANEDLDEESGEDGDLEVEDNASDVEEEMEALFVVVKNEIVAKLAEVVERFGKEILSIESAPISCFNAARANQIGLGECEMILNIGGHCSNLVFADSGRIFVRTIPIAGHSVTQQVAREFNISYSDAEELKRRHGFVALGGAYEEPDSEVAATVSKIVRNIMTRLHGEINRSINVYRSQHKGQRPTKMYLAGGSSVMDFTPRFFNEKLRIPVEYLNPFQAINLADDVDREQLSDLAHMFSEVIGLALRHVTTCPVEITLIPDSIRKLREFNAKKPYFYACCVSIVLCLLINYMGVKRRLSHDKQRADLTQKEVDKTKKVHNEVQAVFSQMEIKRREFDGAVNIAKKRRVWASLLNDIQKELPSRVWITSIKGMTDADVTQAVEARRRATRPARRRAAPEESMWMDGGDSMSGMRQPAAETVKQVDLAWIVFEGHALIYRESEQLAEDFRENLRKSKRFEDEADKVSFVTYEPVKGNNNITYFKLRAKLKQPITVMR